MRQHFLYQSIQLFSNLFLYILFTLKNIINPYLYYTTIEVACQRKKKRSHAVWLRFKVKLYGLRNQNSGVINTGGSETVFARAALSEA